MDVVRVEVCFAIFWFSFYDVITQTMGLNCDSKFVWILGCDMCL